MRTPLESRSTPNCSGHDATNLPSFQVDFVVCNNSAFRDFSILTARLQYGRMAALGRDMAPLDHQPRGLDRLGRVVAAALIALVASAGRDRRPVPVPARTLVEPPPGKLYHGVFPGGKNGMGGNVNHFDVLLYEHAVGKRSAWAKATLADFVGRRCPQVIGLSRWNAAFRNDPATGRWSNMRVEENPALQTIFRNYVGRERTVISRPITRVVTSKEP
jgi:hypothetical protein